MKSPRDGEGRLSEPANVEESLQNSTNTDKRNALVRQCAARPWGRRRLASDRCAPLGDTGNVRDPWQPWRPEELSQKQIEAAAEAAEHLPQLGQHLAQLGGIESARAWAEGVGSVAAGASLAVGIVRESERYVVHDTNRTGH